MNIDKIHMEQIRNLVGDITEEELKYVEFYIGEKLGIFIPNIGFCQYAIKLQHSHPAYSFVLFFSPEQSLIPVNIEVNFEEYLVAGMSPFMNHEEKETDIFTRYIAIFIDMEFYETIYREYMNENPGIYFWKQFLADKDIMIYIKQFMREYENKICGNKEFIENLSHIITHKIVRSILKIKEARESLVEKFEIERVVAHIHQNFGEKLTVNKLASLINISDSNFIRKFKKETNFTPIEYLIKVRLEKSKIFLRENDNTITEIAIKCGFNSSAHFSYCFSKQMGFTPKEYQNLYI